VTVPSVVRATILLLYGSQFSIMIKHLLIDK